MMYIPILCNVLAWIHVLTTCFKGVFFLSCIMAMLLPHLWSKSDLITDRSHYIQTYPYPHRSRPFYAKIKNAAHEPHSAACNPTHANPTPRPSRRQMPPPKLVRAPVPFAPPTQKWRVLRVLLILIRAVHESSIIPILIFRITALSTMARPIPIHKLPRRNRTDDRHKRKEPPRGHDGPLAGAPREQGAGERGAEGAAEGGGGGGEAVEGAEDAEGGARVCEEDRYAGEAEDDGEGFEEHHGHEGGVAGWGVGDEDCVGGQDVDEGEDEGWASVSKSF